MSGDLADRLDAATVERLASLAAIELDEDEKRALSADLTRILGHVAELSALDLSSVPPTAHVDFRGTSAGARREDAPAPELDRDRVLEEAPRTDEGGFVVPTFVDEG